jgi:hypothetical protein
MDRDNIISLIFWVLIFAAIHSCSSSGDNNTTHTNYEPYDPADHAGAGRGGMLR